MIFVLPDYDGSARRAIPQSPQSSVNCNYKSHIGNFLELLILLVKGLSYRVITAMLTADPYPNFKIGDLVRNFRYFFGFSGFRGYF